MSSRNWYTEIERDLSVLPDFIKHYEDELQRARGDLRIRGRLETEMSALPGITDVVFSNLQTIEAVLRMLEIRLRKVRSTVFKKYLENYNRALSSRDCERYVDGDDDVIDLETLVNEIAYLRNRFLSITKALEQKSWMIGHITRLRVAGLDDATIS